MGENNGSWYALGAVALLGGAAALGTRGSASSDTLGQLERVMQGLDSESTEEEEAHFDALVKKAYEEHGDQVVEDFFEQQGF
ncbi:hypothetical protein CMI47_00770 [Candidatus Pacearchaeota archaeon]|nr:hypothetical protein [Candidatus Pacearchaeota archaeon]|tara:strand:- start:442 stop:687 length:246 start_codon:yes stop_codon:yes gene_type:complete